MSKWTNATPTALELALSQCRGSYQRGLILGVENLSGSSLRGKARNWGSRYGASRANLLARLRSIPGMGIAEEQGKHNARILVLRHLADISL